MVDYLDRLAADARATVESEYYRRQPTRRPGRSRAGLREAIRRSHLTPIIAEIKRASPSAGDIRRELDTAEAARILMANGAVGISVLTEPMHFKGSLEALDDVRAAVDLPVLMKDIVVSLEQIEAAARHGADAVLLIKTVFDQGYTEFSLEEAIMEAQGRGLEVLLEAHTLNEYQAALKTKADLIGINNRDLGSMTVDLGTTERILRYSGEFNRTVVSMSGIESPGDVRYLKRCGADAFLVGSAIMRSQDMGEALWRMTHL
ncbi:MAG: indole-3-glycerol-phosphate synthase [Candidatus Bathyarchaeota archaeon]